MVVVGWYGIVIFVFVFFSMVKLTGAIPRALADGRVKKKKQQQPKGKGGKAKKERHYYTAKRNRVL